MKKIIVYLVFMTMLLAVPNGYAEIKAGSVHLSPTLGGYTFEGNEDIDRSLSMGLRAGYNFTKYFGLEGFYHYVPTNIQNGSQEDIDFSGYGVEGLFHLRPDAKLVPFLALGVGGVHYSTAYEDTTEDKRDKFALDYGAGLKYFLTDDFALRADVRHVIPFDGVHNNVLYTVGFAFSFGGAKPAVAAPSPAPAPAPVVLDSDKDGVPDNLDKCPDTPPGCPVDRDGCPLDSDNDGVIDCKDKCPGTPVGVKVDKDGCPLEEKKPEIIEKGRTTLNVLFDFDKAMIKGEYSKDIEDLADLMKKYPDQLKKITIEGHTDSVGSADYNQKLSQRRADAVKAYLIEKGGIDADRLTAIGYGEDRPVASNATEEGRRKNRRVEAESVEYIIKK